MKKLSWILILCTAAGLLMLAAPAGSQTTIVPSKNDQILKKLDEVLSHQKEIKERLSRIEQAIGVKEKKSQENAGGSSDSTKQK